MGGTASIALRAGSAIVTGGASELARKKPFQPGGGTDLKGALLSSAVGPYGTAALAASGQKFDALKQTPFGKAIAPAFENNQAQLERQAQAAANQRKRDYQNLGRSSTLLTGPGGLGGTGQGNSKTLLGS